MAAAKAAKAAEAAGLVGKVVKKPPGDGKKKNELLERMDGGNPAGPPCRNFASGTCNGKCRFSHEGKARGEAEVEEEDE